ncbi:hypothetical protein HMI54_012297, partial [Coelomomyces lativittatus]
MIPAILDNDPNDNDKFLVKKLADGSLIDSYPKSKAPDLTAGIRVVWAEAEVTQDDVIKMVDSGELGTFSWRGKSRIKYRPREDGTVQKCHTNIDVWELSLVDIPDHGSGA